MTTGEISIKEKWEYTHFALSASLEKEIRLMREILTTLHQEELALLENQMRRWKKVMRHHSDLILELKLLRDIRLALGKDLVELAAILGKEELFPHEEESSCEVLSLLDQCLALLSRINLQNCRNGALFEQVKHRGHIPLSTCPCPHPLHLAPRKKTAVALDTKKG
jgi:hypothetical protein